MSDNNGLNKKKWYRVVVTVYRNSDGHIERDSQDMLIDGISAANASRRAYERLRKIYAEDTHSMILCAPYELE